MNLGGIMGVTAMAQPILTQLTKAEAGGHHEPPSRSE